MERDLVAQFHVSEKTETITDSGKEPFQTPSAQDAYVHLLHHLPHMKPLMQELGVLRDVVPKPMPIPAAVTRVVVAQMLSRKAAACIFERVGEVAQRAACQVWELPDLELRRCGLSARKARTVREFAVAFEEDPNHFNSWRHLHYPVLLAQVRRHWGLSDWTAAMLAIFHLGHADVWPHTDGSILRSVGLVSEHLLDGEELDVQAAAPFRSYLALYLWKSLDDGYWKKFGTAGRGKPAEQTRRHF